MSNDLKTLMASLGVKARAAADTARLLSTRDKTRALKAMAASVRAATDDILDANADDMTAGRDKGLSDAMLDRLRLDLTRIDGIAAGLEAIASLPDPVGRIEEQWERPNGLQFSKVRVPIGVIGMIYESRPNVTADAGALCLWSGNACILRGGSEAAQSNTAILKALHAGLNSVGLDPNIISAVPTTDRSAVGMMLEGLNNHIDMIIPRGGKSLIARVQSDARVPVLAHLEGLCHTYVHEGADLEKARNVVINAKLRRTGVCGSTETLLVDSNIADRFLPMIGAALSEAGCEIRADDAARSCLPTAISATDEDFATEHLAAIINVKIVSGPRDAVAHIAQYGSGHTDAIITEGAETARFFLDTVDSAIVMHNASTQFADGGEFGFGAEIGIATGRLHARGPVGAQHLTTYKYTVEGTGQTRP